MNRLALILENAWRNLQEGDGRISIGTQTALLFFLLTLTLTSASIQRYLAGNLDQMLGSDLVVESHMPLPQDREAQLRRMAQGMAVTQLGDITLTHNGAWGRVRLKRVDNAYPLQGDLQIGDSPVATHRAASQGPKVGEIWLEPRLANKLGTQVGDTLTIGDTALRFSAILFHEPDRIMEGHSTVLRAMVNSQSLAGASVANSRSTIRYLIAADPRQLKAIEDWARTALPGAQVIKKVGGEHPLASFWKRTENFLGLASVILFSIPALAQEPAPAC
jgi:putative ABC transport system permease protein